MVSGKWLYPNGSYFKGNFENNQPKGVGQWHFLNGNVVEGAYTQTKRVETGDPNQIKLTWKTFTDPSKAVDPPKE